MGGGAHAASVNRLFVNGLPNATPGITVLAVDWDTKKYYTWSKDKVKSEVPVIDDNGKKVVAVTVEHEITNARIDIQGPGDDWGVAKEFQLNFKQNLSLNQNTEIANDYGALYVNDGDFDLTLNFEKGKNFTAYAKSGRSGEGGIVNGYYHTGNLNINGGTLSIYTVKQDKTNCTAELYALYNESNGALNINNDAVLIQQKDSDAERIYGIKNLASGGINIFTKSLTIETDPDSTSQKNMYSAIYSQGGSKPVAINSEVVSIHDAVKPVFASGGSIVINAAEAYINSAYGTHDDVKMPTWTVHSSNNGSVVFNETGNYKLNTAGYMYADGGSISLRAGADSVMKHRAVIESNGTFNMTLLDRAVWHMPHNNTLTNLVFENGGSVDFNHDYNFSQGIPQYKNLTTSSLSGTGGTLGMRIDMATDADTVLANDQIIVSGVAEGEHKVAIDFVNGSSSIPEDKTHSANWLIRQGVNSNLVLANKEGGNTFSGRGMVSVWSLGFVKTGEETLLDTEEGLQQIAGQTTGLGEGNWFLVKTEVTEPDPNPEPLPPEVEDNLVLGTSAAQAMAWLDDNETLRDRIGEVRYGAQDGSWVRVDAQQDRFRHGFKQESYGVMVGYDRLTERNDSVWLLGGAFRYAESEQDGLGTHDTDGELDQYAVKLYGTWIHDKGSYADIVLQAGRYDQEINGFDNVGTGSSKADYTTYGFGASVEVGQMFTFGNEAARYRNHWFVEPQFELSYFYAKGKDYTTSTGLRVEQGNADFLNGRAGVVLGKKFDYGTPEDKRFFQIAMTGGVNHEFMGDQTIRYRGVDGASKSIEANAVDGTRFYYGLTADWQCADRWRAYASVEREEGDGYTQDYDVNIGVRYAF